MMRKIFGGAMAFSMVGAVVLGGVLAWTNSQSYTETSEVGNLSFTQQHTHLDRIIGPDDDHLVYPDTGHITNASPSDSFRIQLDTAHSKVDILDTHKPGHSDSDQANCAISWFGGVVESIGNPAVLNPGDVGDDFRVGLRVHPGAPTSCQADDVNYMVTLYANTVGQ